MRVKLHAFGLELEKIANKVLLQVKQFCYSEELLYLKLLGVTVAGSYKGVEGASLQTWVVSDCSIRLI